MESTEEEITITTIEVIIIIEAGEEEVLTKIGNIIMVIGVNKAKILKVKSEIMKIFPVFQMEYFLSTQIRVTLKIKLQLIDRSN